MSGQMNAAEMNTSKVKSNVSRPIMAAIDVDGTLVEPGEIVLRENEEAIKRAVAGGIHVVISTGRPYEGIRAIIQRLGLTDPVVTLGGSKVMSASGEVYCSYPLPPAMVRAIYEYCAARGLSLRAHSDGEVHAYFRNRNHPDIRDSERIRGWMPIHVRIMGGVGIPAEGMPMTDGMPVKEMPVRDVSKVTIMFEDESMGARLRPEIESEFASLHRANSSNTWLEFTGGGTSKLRGVKHVARMLGVRRGDVMAIGDNENDLEMIKWAGMGVYVRTAPENLKAFARLIPPPGVPAVAWGLSQLMARGVSRALEAPGGVEDADGTAGDAAVGDDAIGESTAEDATAADTAADSAAG